MDSENRISESLTAEHDRVEEFKYPKQCVIENLFGEWMATPVMMVISRDSGLILVCPCIPVRLSWADKTSILPLFQ